MLGWGGQGIGVSAGWSWAVKIMSTYGRKGQQLPLKQLRSLQTLLHPALLLLHVRVATRMLCWKGLRPADAACCPSPFCRLHHT